MGALHCLALSFVIVLQCTLTLTFSPFTESGTTITHVLSLGDTQVGVVEWFPRGHHDDLGLPLRFLNLHQNENCSVASVKAMLTMRGTGSVVYFNKTLTSNGLATRNVSFTKYGKEYTFDPNRMFTKDGISSNVYPPDDSVVPDIYTFGQSVLSIYTRDVAFEWVAIHNNALSGSFSAQSYLPGQVYAADAAAVNIGTYSTPKEFILLTYTAPCIVQYETLSEMGFSVVLQAPAGPNSTLSDDGSLSYYTATIGQDYVNVESTAPPQLDHEASHLINQLFLFKHLADILLPPRL